MRRSVNLQPTVARLRWTRGADEHPSNPSYNKGCRLSSFALCVFISTPTQLDTIPRAWSLTERMPVTRSDFQVRSYSPQFTEGRIVLSYMCVCNSGPDLVRSKRLQVFCLGWSERLRLVPRSGNERAFTNARSC